MSKQIGHAISTLLGLTILVGCADLTILSGTTPQVSLPYLGQEPPGMEPEIFAPGIVSHPDFTEYSGTFSPDGSEYYFYRVSDASGSILLFSKFVEGDWTAPEQLAGTAGYGAYAPHLSFDNQWLFFAWNHPVPTGEPGFPAYFAVERTGTGWSEPRYSGQGMFLSSDRDGEFFITDMSSRELDDRTYVAKVTVSDGLFTNYERLDIQPPWGYPAHPCISPDGSYLLFDVDGGSYLFVIFKNSDGTWGEPVDLTSHGFDPRAGGAYLSPDGKYLFFALLGDIWWVDGSVIENLRAVK